MSGVSESGIELLVLDAIIDAGSPTPDRPHRVEVSGRRFRLDLAYPGRRIAIEVDGAHHADLDVEIHDRERTRRLVATP